MEARSLWWVLRNNRSRQRDDAARFRSGGVVERVASLVARQFLAAAAAFGILVLAACGTLSPQDLTAIAELEPSPTPVADVVAMFGGNPSGDGVFDARGPTFAPDEAWRFPAADITSPPVVSGGLVLVSVADGASESGFYLSAFDARAQRELWRFATGRQVYSAPAVSDGVVYLASTDSRLYALDAATGEEQWRFQAVGGSWASPVVSDGTVFFTASDGHLYALDATTGEERWRFELFGPRQLDANSFGRGTWLSPSVHDGTVYAGSLDWHLYAIDAATGQEKWRFKTKGAVWGSPAISDGMVYFGSNDLNLYAVDAATGVERWKFRSHWPLRASPVVFNNTVIFQRGYVHGLDSATGEEKWRTEIIAQGSAAQPIASGGNGLVYLTGRGDIYALDPETGAMWWEKDVEGSPSGYLTVEDNALYAVIRQRDGAYLLALE